LTDGLRNAGTGNAHRMDAIGTKGEGKRLETATWGREEVAHRFIAGT
jgi:hypothetical protein